ncbi:aminoglycoside phosphotransferase family protein [Streptomyces luteolus]|uniref:Aminoglycoside phosphotransferase family protein n=1 Tax=Streptomyces luteolus TaxID=3043615 RepID=A0ABT6SRM0_9ACTN|nr:aminoglycoside phosphotransferase family protein [Streptomyces sp. B-S-A12]MDI3417297.1 aminoglycoside phosphotransferase family protein [Streptomyces sp. B-S-A12]
MAHYGLEAGSWLDAAPQVLAEAAERWKLTLESYHDAGHSSVVAVARDIHDTAVLLKAWYARARYRDEVTALRLWASGPTAGVIETADDLSVASLELVGGRPGGGARPAREVQMVAAVIQGLHAVGAKRGRPALPRLGDHLQHTVLPRVARRAGTLGLDRRAWLVREAMPELQALRESPSRTTVLHADLYRENVIFDGRGNPRLIDPHPLVGDAAYDWAFWSVYYDLGQATFQRLAIASRISRIPVPEISAWCRAVALDGLLYYSEIGDPAQETAAEVLAALMASGLEG